MHTLRLKVNDKVFDKLVWFLGKFSNDEVEIINEDSEFFDNQKYLEKELKELINGKTNLVEIDEAEARLENRIKNHENSL
jgi:hypothetical protein